MPSGMTKVKRFQGVYYRESADKRYRGEPDKCFYVNYRRPGEKGTTWEKIGWASQGVNAAYAAQILAERTRSIRHGETVVTGKNNVTFGEVWKKYDEWLSSSRTTPEDDRGRYRKHIEPRFGSRPLSKISPFDLERMKSELLKEGLSPATVKHCLVVVRQVFNKAMTWGLWRGDNPISSVTLPKPSNRKERYLSVEEVTALLGRLQGVSFQTYAIAFTSLHTGMRAGEIFGLLWGHVDLKNGLLHIADPKNKSPRKAYIDAELKSLIEEIGPGAPEELVFQARCGGKIRQISDSYFRAVVALGFNDGITDERQRVNFHTLRHTFASWLAIAGTPILTISELLGHKSLTMTMRYAHLAPDHKREAVKVISETMGDVGREGNTNPGNK